MSSKKGTVTFAMRVRVEKREEYFTAYTQPFAITVYGNSPDEAERNALNAVTSLLDVYSKTYRGVVDYLNRRNVKHTVHTEEMEERQDFTARTSEQEFSLRVPVGA